MTLSTHLHALEAAGLIRLAAAAPDLEYTFRHTLIQDAAYASMLKGQRNELHLAVARSMEQLYAHRLSELAPVLGHHYGQAGDEARALHYFTLAGDTAFSMYANPEAVEHYARALEAAAPLPEVDSARLRHLHLRLGRALELNGQFDEALAHYDQMIARARERGDGAMQLDGLVAAATVYAIPTSRHDPDRVQALCDQALTLAHELGDRAGEAKILSTLTLAHRFAGRSAEALQTGQRALDLGRALGLKEQVAYTLNDMRLLYVNNDQVAQAMAAHEESLALWRELGNLPMLVDSLAGAAVLRVMVGEYEPALSLFAEAQSLSQRIGNTWGQSYSRYMLYFVYAEHGDPARAIQAAEECIEFGEQASFVVPSVQTRAELALMYSDLGDHTRALAQAQQAHATAVRLATQWQALPLAALAMVTLGRDPAAAQAFLAEAYRHLDAQASRLPEALFVRIADVTLAVAGGQFARAIELAGEMEASYFGSSGFRIFFPDVLYLKAQAFRGLGDGSAARAALHEARSAAEALGSRRTLWRILHALSELELNSGQAAAAEHMRREAAEIVDYIADRVPDGGPAGASLRELFLGLPEVRAVKESG